MKDTNGNGVQDFFKWKQPYSNSSIDYQAMGVSNLQTNMTQANVTPSSGTWGQYFNYSVFVNDTENDTLIYNVYVAYNDSNGRYTGRNVTQ